MIEIAETDFEPLDQSPENWRWTKFKDRIRLLSREKSDQVRERFRRFISSDDLVPDLFQAVSSCDASEDTGQVKRWLSTLGLCGEVAVLVCWSTEIAVLAPWSIFCNFWNDFCLPSSDDVQVIPCSEEWALFYHHEENFAFGWRRT